MHKNNSDAKNSQDEKHHHHHRKATTRRKQKSTSPMSSAESSATSTPSKPSQHTHTNGLINSTEKLNNCLSNNNNNNSSNNSANLMNGDDDSAVKSAQLEDEQLEKLKDENMEARSLVFKEIRKLGRDYSGLYQQLSKVKGNFDMRFTFIQMCIDEANRFRRKHMATCIQEWWENSLEQTSRSKT
jgi:integrator complex subunit 6